MRMKIRDDRQMRTLIGVTESQFEILLAAFTYTCIEIQWQSYQKGLAEGSRKPHPGGGRKGALLTMRDKLLFLLYYFKV